MTYIETNSTEKMIKSLREELDRASKDKARFNTVFDEDDTFIAPPHPSLKRTGTSKAPVKIELISDEEKEKNPPGSSCHLREDECRARCLRRA